MNIKTLMRMSSYFLSTLPRIKTYLFIAIRPSESLLLGRADFCMPPWQILSGYTHAAAALPTGLS